MNMLQHLTGPQDLKCMTMAQLQALSVQIRLDLIERVTQTGGHIGSNLGLVEATVALHYVFNSPVDKIVFDVSHQSYVHKMLTGRYDAFMRGDTAGYTNPQESAHDVFAVGHTSTAVSLAVGLAKARDMLGSTENVIAVLGDGSLSGGEAFEGLDNAAALGSNLIVLFNDNEMSIAPNVGGIYDGLAELRRTDGQSTDNLFTAMGLAYRYVADGNDLPSLIQALQAVKDSPRPVVVHIHTQKGKGLPWAEQERERGHWTPPAAWTPSARPSLTEATAQWLAARAAYDAKLCVINAATPGAAGFTPQLRAQMGAQFVDVGICEPHAVAMASGMARRGARPVFVVFSSFVQRTYDQLMQDLALNCTPAVILVYGGGFSAGDPTHVGMYDIAMIGNIPGLTCLAPCSETQHFAMLQWALEQTEGPVVIRVPTRYTQAPKADAAARTSIWRNGENVALLGLGDAAFYALQAADELQAKGVRATVAACADYGDADTAALDALLQSGHRLFVTLETGIMAGGFGQKAAAYLSEKGATVLVRGATRSFVDRMPVAQQLQAYRMTAAQIAEDVLAVLQER